MAALAPQPRPTPPNSFAERVAAAQGALAEGIVKAGLQRDPLRYPLEALAMTLGLFPELSERLETARQPVQGEELRKAVRRGIADLAGDAVRALNLRNILVGVALGTGLVLAGGVCGYWLRGAVPALAGIRAGADRCQDRPDGSRLCWIPVFERLPPAR